MTVAQLAESLDLSQQAVRRHLDGLRADGLIDVRQERHGVGRPALVFFATERGEELGGRTYLQLLSRMFRHLEKLDDSQGQRRQGKQVLEEVFCRHRAKKSRPTTRRRSTARRWTSASPRRAGR